jgi:hypothetical protein
LPRANLRFPKTLPGWDLATRVDCGTRTTLPYSGRFLPVPIVERFGFVVFKTIVAIIAWWPYMIYMDLTRLEMVMQFSLGKSIYAK